MDREQAYEELLSLHAQVEGSWGELAEQHAGRLECSRGCSACCVDGLSVFQVEAERLRRRAGAVLDEAPGPEGGCAFLDDSGACRVYADRPYVCRTQGLPLAWYEEEPGGEEIVERRTICELNAEGPPLEELGEEQVWLLGPVELRLQQLQQAFGGDQERVPLRRLFRT